MTGSYNKEKKALALSKPRAPPRCALGAMDTEWGKWLLFYQLRPSLLKMSNLSFTLFLSKLSILWTHVVGKHTSSERLLGGLWSCYVANGKAGTGMWTMFLFVYLFIRIFFFWREGHRCPCRAMWRERTVNLPGGSETENRRKRK